MLYNAFQFVMLPVVWVFRAGSYVIDTTLDWIYA